MRKWAKTQLITVLVLWCLTWLTRSYLASWMQSGQWIYINSLGLWDSGHIHFIKPSWTTFQLNKGRKLCAHPFLEIYREGRIQYMAPLARQGDFYVPEVRRAERRLSAGDGSDSDTDVSGAESNSEYSGSGVLLSDSRETSRAPSSVHSSLRHDRGGSRDDRNSTASSSTSSFEELDPEPPGGRKEPGEEEEEDPDITEEQGVVAGGEE